MATTLKPSSIASAAITLLFALGPVLAQAQASPDLFTGTAAMTGFAYHLVDLAPDDGVTPWIQFGQGLSAPAMGYLSPLGHADYWTEEGPTYPADGSTSYTGFLPSTPVIAQSLDGLASAQANASAVSVSTHTTLNSFSQVSAGSAGDPLAHLDVSSTAATRTPLSAFDYEVDPDSGSTRVSATAFEAGQGANFTMSARTRLVIDGVLDARIAFNRGALSADLQAALADGSASIEGVAGAGVLLSLANREADLDGTVWPSVEDAVAAVMAITHQSSESLFLDTADGDTGAEAKAFSLALENSEASDAQGFLGFALGTNVGLHVPKALVPSASAPLPEPGTWALTGLGMLGLGAIARRRH
ncbi:MAG: PEP-CTERM sorting domain-containing protein [Rubrivivax sp.]|nr:MAG: PEP-CTERM sorting domain-containing protein [Rubrivivax sp.]